MQLVLLGFGLQVLYLLHSKPQCSTRVVRVLSYTKTSGPIDSKITKHPKVACAIGFLEFVAVFLRNT